MGDDELKTLPDSAEDARTFFMSTIVPSGEKPEVAYGSLAADSFTWMLWGGRYIGCSGDELYDQMAGTFGFVSKPLAEDLLSVDGRALKSYWLDLTRVGVERWLNSLMKGTTLPTVLRQEELEAAIQEALVQWQDSASLAASPLASMVDGAATPGTDESAERVRELLRKALQSGSRKARVEQELAFEAIRLAYVDRRWSHERAAEKLAVSRSTFYRLLKRGISDLAATFASERFES